MAATVINLTCPKAWGALTAAQRRELYTLMADGWEGDELRTVLLLRWAGLSVTGRRHDGFFDVTHQGRQFPLHPAAMAAMLSALEWTATPPADPSGVWLPEIGRAKTVAADLSGVPFGHWLALDNLFEGLLATGKPDLADQAAALLAPGCRVPLDDADRVAVQLWLLALKAWLTKRYPDLYAPQGDGGSLAKKSQAEVLRERTDAQLRALTKGDPTREDAVLALDTHRALTELNAQAREAAEIRKSLPR